jgi:hypothetical protein
MNHLLHLFVELWIHKGGCAISVQHYLRMAPFHSSYMEKWHKKLHISETKQIRGHWYKPPYPFFSVILIILIKKLIKWPPFLVSTKKHHVQQNVHNTVVLSSKFCMDIIFSFGNMKLFVSFFHITAVKRCINIINITEKNGYGGLYQWPLICFSILLRNNCHNGGHFENKMAAIAKSTFFKITLSFLVRIWSSRYQIKDILKIYNLN